MSWYLTFHQHLNLHSLGVFRTNPWHKLLRALKSNTCGLSETDIRDLFGRHKSANEIQRSLNNLTKMGLAHLRTVSTEGRPRAVWCAT